VSGPDPAIDASARGPLDTPGPASANEVLPGSVPGTSSRRFRGTLGEVAILYRETLALVRAFAEHHRRAVAISVEAGLIFAFVLMRSAGWRHELVSAWDAAAIGVALVSPTSGLTVLLATAPFPDWEPFGQDGGQKMALVGAMGFGLLVRGVAAGRVGRVPVTLRWALLTWAGTGLALMHTIISFDDTLRGLATERWLAGLGGAFVVLAVAVWSVRQGTIRPLVVAVGAVAVAGAASLLDYAAPHLIRETAFEWMLRARRSADRVTGIVNGPNAVATLLTTALAVPFLVTVLSSGRRRWLLAPVVVFLTVVVVLTLSRSGLLALLALVVVAVAYHRPRAALVVLVVGCMAFLALMPIYLRLRAQALGAGTVEDLALLVTGDTKRLTAWATAVRLWLEEPLTGHGYLAFLPLRATLGVMSVTHPHNEILRLLVEGGIGLALAFLAFVASAARELWQARTPLTFAALGALVCLVLGAQFNNPYQFAQVTYVGFAIVGAGLGRAWAVRDAVADGSG
jgi:O-antigen ligase